MKENLDRGRREFFRALLAAPMAFVVAMRFPWPDRLAAAVTPRPAKAMGANPDSSRGTFPPTPECGDDDDPTPSETEGPFYKPRSPQRTSLLEPGIRGTKIVVTGRVFSRECRPLSGVLVDFWHADHEGDYDNVGFKLRGHQFTDEMGRYRLETIVPGVYPGRTRHFHVKVQAPKGRVLTTQLYFPGEPRNQDDFLFRPDLLMTVKEGEGSKQARFHFLIDHA